MKKVFRVEDAYIWWGWKVPSSTSPVNNQEDGSEYYHSKKGDNQKRRQRQTMAAAGERTQRRRLRRRASEMRNGQGRENGVAARRKAFIREGRNPKLIPARQLAGRSTAGRFHMGHKIIQPRKASLSTEQNCQVFLPVVGAEHQTFQISLFFFLSFKKKIYLFFFLEMLVSLTVTVAACTGWFLL